MVHLRFIGITAGIAFFLALLTGLFGGAGFGLVFMRSVLTGAFFGGLAFVLRWVIDRYLPGLITSEKTPAGEEPEQTKDDFDEEEPGTPESLSENNVDIVIEEENPHASKAVSAEEFVEEMENSSDSESGELEETEETEEMILQAPAGNDEDSEENLPNLDQFSSSFSGMESELLESGKDFTGKSDFAGQNNVEIMGSEHSTTDLVKAVQTLLTKDEKG